MLTQEEYVESNGLKCPVCGGNEVTTDSSPEVFDFGIMQHCSCICGATWTDFYKLSGYNNLEKGQEDGND